MPDDFEHLSMMWFEEALRWSASELRYPQITCFQAEGIGSQSPMSLENLQDMRCLTALNLTHSDGFFVYTMGIQREVAERAHVHDSSWRWVDPDHDAHHTAGIVHEHHHAFYYYDFYDADLGRPIGEKFQRCESIEGLFIWKFTNGWGVYNRSGTEQEISLPIEATGVASGITSFKHTLPGLDGEMYLKTEVNADVNGDGVVNIQDLVIVANAFGKAEPDLNGDDVVNILDLVIVANNFTDN